MHPTIAHGLVLQRHAELRREADEMRLIQIARLGVRPAARVAAWRSLPGRAVPERRAVVCEDGSC